MGHPRFQRKKYKSPRHPWEAERIIEENQLTKEYGLKKKTEIWRASSKLKNWQTQVKNIVGLTGKQGEEAERILLTKLIKLGILSEKATLDDVLGLTIRDVLERRLQTILYKKGMAQTPKHARQLIVHKKITINDIKVSSPSYFVKAVDKLGFIQGFSFKPQDIKKEQIPRTQADKSAGPHRNKVSVREQQTEQSVKEITEEVKA